jgi:hypothetical protein
MRLVLSKTPKSFCLKGQTNNTKLNENSITNLQNINLSSSRATAL